MDTRCELEGCLYNQNGFCNYEEAPIKEPFYRGCRDPYDNGDYE